VLVPPDDPAALAAAISGLLAEPARAAALAASGRVTWAERYAVGPVVARWRDFLGSVNA